LEKFDTNKIIKGIKKAVDESKINDEDIETFVEEVEKYVMNSEEPVHSKEIGLMILDWLKTKDTLAYIRFASVYKSFRGIDDVKKEIRDLENI